jgi:poly(A) polymerase
VTCEKLLKAFEEAGGMAWFVGGCVRDAILGIETDDIDICTDLHPKAVMRVLGDTEIKVVPTGLNHGTVTAIENKRHFEITTLRQDVKSHGRHADVAFTNDLKEDAARRDFTFNALYLTPHGDLIDPYDGMSDLKSGRVRFIGSAEDRIREDRLRVLRFFRFFARFGKMPPDQEAMDACRSARTELTQLSVERISKEVMLLLRTDDPSPSLRLMQETGVLSEVFGPKVTLEMLSALVGLAVPSDELIKFASLFNANAEDVLSLALNLRMSTKSKDRLIHMCRQDLPADISKQDLDAALYKNGARAIADQVILRMAREGNSKQLASALNYAKDWRVPIFPVKGSDLIALGAKSGPELGMALTNLEDAWIASDFKATKTDLLERYNSQTS